MGSNKMISARDPTTPSTCTTNSGGRLSLFSRKATTLKQQEHARAVDNEWSAPPARRRCFFRPHLAAYTLIFHPLLFCQVTQFLRLARDCQVVDEGGTTSSGSPQGRCSSRAAPRPNRQLSERRIGQAAVNLVFASIIQGRAKVIVEKSVGGVFLCVLY